MGNKKFIIIFAVIFLLFVGWLLAFKSVTRADEIKKHEEEIEVPRKPVSMSARLAEIKSEKSDTN